MFHKRNINHIKRKKYKQGTVPLRPPKATTISNRQKVVLFAIVASIVIAVYSINLSILDANEITPHHSPLQAASSKAAIASTGENVAVIQGATDVNVNVEAERNQQGIINSNDKIENEQTDETIAIQQEDNDAYNVESKGETIQQDQDELEVGGSTAVAEEDEEEEERMVTIPKEDIGKYFKAAEIEMHNTPDSAWIVLENKVYDVTKWLRRHPGGYDIVFEHAGFNATESFDMSNHSPRAHAIKKLFFIGYAADAVLPPVFMRHHDNIDVVEVTDSDDPEVARWWQDVLGGSLAPEDPCYGPIDFLTSPEKEESDYEFKGFIPVYSLSRRKAHEAYESELAMRQIADIHYLTEFDLYETPTDYFFIRTGIPKPIEKELSVAYKKANPAEIDWNIAILGQGALWKNVTFPELHQLSNDNNQGSTVIECSGNRKDWKFGLLSTGRWTAGITIIDLLAHALNIDNPDLLEENLRKRGCKDSCTHILIEGFDRHVSPKGGTRGASWVFSMEQVRDTGMFLATEMNGKPLTLNHGFPVRLIVPRWYGCTNIKWVTAIHFVNGKATPPTSQMREFRSRVHVKKTINFMKSSHDWSAQMGLSATATRMEIWQHKETKIIQYKVVGLVWGDSHARNHAALVKKLKEKKEEKPISEPLHIRMNKAMTYTPVTFVNERESANTWAQWCHVFQPTKSANAPLFYEVELTIKPNPNLFFPRLRPGINGKSWYATKFQRPNLTKLLKKFN